MFCFFLTLRIEATIKKLIEEFEIEESRDSKQKLSTFIDDMTFSLRNKWYEYIARKKIQFKINKSIKIEVNKINWMKNNEVQFEDYIRQIKINRILKN